MSSDRLQVLRDEAEAILQAVQRLGESFPKALALLEKRKGRCVVSGMGKSGLVGRKISATMASLGT
nr:KpsF/GutQ family sugar-phosphate isomerase [bacterium]